MRAESLCIVLLVGCYWTRRCSILVNCYGEPSIITNVLHYLYHYLPAKQNYHIFKVAFNCLKALLVVLEMAIIPPMSRLSAIKCAELRWHCVALCLIHDCVPRNTISRDFFPAVVLSTMAPIAVSQDIAGDTGRCSYVRVDEL